MRLRNFLYLNSKLVDDYLSAIEGYIYDWETRTDNQTNQKSGEVKVGIPIVSGRGQMDNSTSSEIKKEVQITDAAKFEKVFNYLDELKYYEFLTETEFVELTRDDFVEVLVTPRFSKTKEIADTMQKFGQLADTFQSLTDESIINSKAQKAIAGLSKLGELNQENSISTVFSFEDEHFPLIAYLDKQYFKVAQDRFVGQVTYYVRFREN